MLVVSCPCDLGGPLSVEGGVLAGHDVTRLQGDNGWAGVQLQDVTLNISTTAQLHVTGNNPHTLQHATVHIAGTAIYDGTGSLFQREGSAIEISLTGFLRPEDGTGRWQACVSCLVRAKLSVPDGTVIRNVAPPSSRVAPLTDPVFGCSVCPIEQSTRTGGRSVRQPGGRRCHRTESHRTRQRHATAGIYAGPHHHGGCQSLSLAQHTRAARRYRRWPCLSRGCAGCHQRTEQSSDR